MPLFDNENRILQIEAEKEEILRYLEDPLIRQPFIEDFARRFSWSTNAIEGNTLSLEETVAVQSAAKLEVTGEKCAGIFQNLDDFLFCHVESSLCYL